MSELDRKKLNERDMRIINKIENVLLVRKLKRLKIDISKEDLNILIIKYNQLIDFYLEDDRRDSQYRFGFVAVPKSFYDQDDVFFLKIFRLLIDMQKNNLLNYLDYCLLINYQKYGGNRLYELYDYLDNMLKWFYENDNNYDFIYGFIKEREYLLQDIIENNLSDINASSYIPQEYKDIMNLYDKIFDKYYLEDYDEIDPDAFFQEYMNMTYYYFVINDLFNQEPNGIIEYLNKVKDNIVAICDKLNNDGELEYKDRIKYIDTLYKGRNKVKIIK